MTTLQILVTIGIIIIVISWILLTIALIKAPVYHFDNKFPQPPGIGKTIEHNTPYKVGEREAYYREEIKAISRFIHSK